MKRRNPTWGCPRIAQQIALAFGIPMNKDVVRRILAVRYQPNPDATGPSWLTILGHAKDSLWSVDLFRCKSAILRAHWVLVVMDQFTRRIVGVGVHRGAVDGVGLCRMFNRATRGHTPQTYLSSDHDRLGECPVAVLWVRRSETNRPSKCLEDTRGELARKGLTHRRMSNDSPKIQWSCQRIKEQVGVGIPRQFSGRDGLLDQGYIHGSSRQIEACEEESPKHGIFLNITDQADGDGGVLRMKPLRAADHTLMQPFERRSLTRWRQRRLHPRQKCVEHDRLLALPPTIQRGRAHACLPGQFLRRY